MLQYSVRHNKVMKNKRNRTRNRTEFKLLCTASNRHEIIQKSFTYAKLAVSDIDTEMSVRQLSGAMRVVHEKRRIKRQGEV